MKQRDNNKTQYIIISMCDIRLILEEVGAELGIFHFLSFTQKSFILFEISFILLSQPQLNLTVQYGGTPP